jgi:hypothetical protein
VPVAHACHPSYSRGRDQEDHSSKPAQANSSERPYLEEPFTKIGLVEWPKVKAPSSSPRTAKKKKKKKIPYWDGVCKLCSIWCEAKGK